MSLLLLLTDEDAAAAEAITPTLDEVAALERERTYAEGGQEGTFTNETRPTGVQVGQLIEFAVNDVLSRIGLQIPEKYWGEARRMASLQAAALIESSYFPAQLDSDQSAYRQYTAMFLAGMEKLVENVRQPSALRLV